MKLHPLLISFLVPAIGLHSHSARADADLDWNEIDLARVWLRT